MPEDETHSLAEEFRDLNDLLRRGGSREVARQRLVDLARDEIEGCDWASLSLHTPGRPARTLTRACGIEEHVDGIQYEVGEGPCLQAARSRECVYSEDLVTEERWPEFRRRALAESPVRAVLCFHLTDDPAPTALNLYSATSGGFDDEAMTVGMVFAIHAAVLLAHADTVHRLGSLETALASSRQIGAAVGILMSVRKIPQPEAFDLLRDASNRLNRKLHDVALDVTDAGDLPTAGRH